MKIAVLVVCLMAVSCASATILASVAAAPVAAPLAISHPVVPVVAPYSSEEFVVPSWYRSYLPHYYGSPYRYLVRRHYIAPTTTVVRSYIAKK